MAETTKMTFTIVAQGTRRFLDELAQTLEDVSVPGQSTVSGKPVYKVLTKRVITEVSDL